MVVGTGTGVGKTHVSCALLAHAKLVGVACVGLKPIESGVRDGVVSDAARLAAHSVVVAPEAPYRFAEPVSPHLAARAMGQRISVRKAVDWVSSVRADVRVVETAGGLMSPLAPLVWNRHLVEALAPHAVVLVAADRLGVLHDVGATLAALGRGASPMVVVLSGAGAPDASTGRNANELLEAGVVNAAVPVFRRGDVDDLANAEAAAGVWASLFG